MTKKNVILLAVAVTLISSIVYATGVTYKLGAVTFYDNNVPDCPIKLGDVGICRKSGELYKRKSDGTDVAWGSGGVTIGSGQVAYAPSANTLGGSANLTWANTTGRLTIGGSGPSYYGAGTTLNIAESAGETEYIHLNAATGIEINATNADVTLSADQSIKVNGGQGLLFNTASGATAQPGAMRYNGTKLQFSNASSWIDIPTAGGGSIGGTIANAQIPFGTGTDTIGDSGWTFGVDGTFGAGYYTLQHVNASTQTSLFNSARSGMSFQGTSQIYTYLNGNAVFTVQAAKAGPTSNLGLDLGSDGVSFADAYLRSWKMPPMTAPGNPSSGWVIYTDAGDGNKLKAKASTGTTITLGTP